MSTNCVEEVEPVLVHDDTLYTECIHSLHWVGVVVQSPGTEPGVSTTSYVGICDGLDAG